MNEWHAARRAGLSSSDLAAILGLNSRRSPWMVAREKLGLEPEPDPRPPSEDAYWGDAMEPLVAAAFSDRTGTRLLRSGEAKTRMPNSDIVALADGQRTRLVVVRRDQPIFRSTPDFFGQSQEGEDGIVEVKTTGKIAAWKDGPPRGVWLQTQWHMLAAGWKRAWIPVLFYGRTRTLGVFSLKLDPRFEPGGMIETRALAWWQRHVVEQQPVIPLAADIPYLNRKNPHGNGATVVVPKGQPELDSRYALARAEYDRLLKATNISQINLKSAEAPIRALMGGASFAEFADVPGVTYSLFAAARGGRVLRRKVKK